MKLMCNFRSKIRRQDGFIAIIALGIIALMAIFIVMLAKTTQETYKNIKATKDYYLAQSVINSLLEGLELELSEKDFGYNFEATCTKEDFGVGITKPPGATTATPTSENDPSKQICAALADHIQTQGVEEIEVTFKIVGRPKDEEKFIGDCPGITGGKCYTVPFPGIGNAGDRCNLYNESLKFDKAKNKVGLKVNNKGQIQEVEGVSQLDYSCNWNKLVLGSSSTDRVAIPLYYTTTDANGNAKIVNPFNSSENLAKNFILRMRTPCDKSLVKGEDKSNCVDGYRYILNEADGNDILIQWQLTGQCVVNGKEEECGLIQSPKEVGQLLDEAMINGKQQGFSKNQVIKGDLTEGENLNESEKNPNILDQLKTMTKPIFALFLNKKLISTKGNSEKIPYLEYQILTDYPVADAQTKMEVSVKVNGTQQNKTIYKANKKDLIDFAIQN